MGKSLSEQQVEQAALGWFEALGFDVRKGADISPGADTPLRDSHEHVVLEPRLRAALRRINSHLPEEAGEHGAALDVDSAALHPRQSNLSSGGQMPCPIKS